MSNQIQTVLTKNMIKILINFQDQKWAKASSTILMETTRQTMSKSPAPIKNQRRNKITTIKTKAHTYQVKADGAEAKSKRFLYLEQPKN